MALAGDVERVVVGAAQDPVAQLEARCADGQRKAPSAAASPPGERVASSRCCCPTISPAPAPPPCIPSRGTTSSTPRSVCAVRPARWPRRSRRWSATTAASCPTSAARRCRRSSATSSVRRADRDGGRSRPRHDRGREPREAPQPAGPQRPVRQRRRPLDGYGWPHLADGARSEAPRRARRSFGAPPNPPRSAMHPSIRHYAIRIDRDNALERADFAQRPPRGAPSHEPTSRRSAPASARRSPGLGPPVRVAAALRHVLACALSARRPLRSLRRSRSDRSRWRT